MHSQAAAYAVRASVAVFVCRGGHFLLEWELGFIRSYDGVSPGWPPHNALLTAVALVYDVAAV